MSEPRKFRGFVGQSLRHASWRAIGRTVSDLLGQAITAGTAVIVALLALPHANLFSSDAVLLEFASAHCNPCRAMQPVINSLEKAGVPIRHVDVTSEPHLASKYGVRQTPTYIVVAGGNEIARLVGVHSAAEIQSALETSQSGPLIPTGADVQFQHAPQTRMTPTLQSSVGEVRQASFQQNPPRHGEPMPSAARAGAVERAQAATVRLKVHDASGFDTGTGTIIDARGEEALVITCGHLFRESKFDGKIEVDLFIGGQIKTVAGQLVDYDADNHDIALVAIRPGFPVQPVQVIASNDFVDNGQPVFSFGCDKGDDPSRRDSRITGINKYNQHMGASNIEIQVAPVKGRSGGGLFDANGRLIGVCNAADYQSDVGIYTGPGSIRWQLNRVQLASLYQETAKSIAAEATQGAPRNRIASLPASNSPVAQGSSGQEVIVIVRDRNNPQSPQRVMNLPPNAEVLRLLEQHATRQN